MRWSFPIGRVSGITLRLHVTFLLFLAFIGYGGFMESGWRGAGWAVAMFGSIFACVVLHELGHSLVAQQLGVQVKSITLLPIGGVAALRNVPEHEKKPRTFPLRNVDRYESAAAQIAVS